MAISKRNIAIITLFACLLSYSASYATPPSDEEMNLALASAETLFKAMRAKQYPEIWQGLTGKTKISILNAVFRELKKAGTELTREKIASDFESGGAVSRAYWDGYLLVFNPELVLEQSRWTLGPLRKDRAEINILYRKSDKPATLQLFKESNQWKVGLNETFGTRNIVPFF